MSKGKKIVENYQILQILEQYQSQYSILLARHLADKKLYMLKRLTTKNGNNQLLYTILLNQANLLKNFKHDSIITCYRMLKTSTSFYIAYSYLQGNTLEEILQLGPKALTFSQKQSLAKEICLAIVQMNTSSIAHLNLIPANIVVGKKMKIMIKEFIYAMEIPEEGEIDLKRKVPKNQFIASEVRREIACLQADIYSFGKILEKLEFRKCKKEASTVDNKKKIEEYELMIQGMTRKDRHKRLSLNQVYKCIFSKLKKVKRMRSLSESGAISSRNSISSSMSSTKSQFGSKKLYSQIILKLMRQRSMSWLLIKLFKTVTVSVKLNSQCAIILGMMLLKKSTKLLANLGKYLHYGKNDIQIDINTKDQAKFFKTADYNKMLQIVDKQIAIQRNEFNAAAEMIFIHNTSLLKKAEFSKQMKEEEIDHIYFTECIKNFLRQVISSQDLISELKPEIVADLALLGYIAAAQTYEDFFRTKFVAEELGLEQQPFLKKLKESTKQQMIQNLLKTQGSKLKRATTLQMLQI